MNAIEAQLETAEFEALWLEVRYHEGRASVAEVERAIRRVDQLKRIAARMDEARLAGETFPWPETAAVAAVGH
jgi:hypothetical protein